MARIGINGFGRIGRYLVRLMAERNEFPVVINARADNASLAHLFKYDSVHHTFKGTVGHDENGIIINGTHIAVTRCKPNEWQWKDYGVDLVVEQLPFRYVRWVTDTAIPVAELKLTSTSGRAQDAEERDVLLFENEWSIRLAQENNKGLELSELAPRAQF